MQKDDIEAIATIHLDSWQATYANQLPVEYIEQYTLERRARMWSNIYATSVETVYVAEKDNEVVGFINYGPSFTNQDNHDLKELRSIYVAPSMVNQGIGRQLIATISDELKSTGCKELVLYVLSTHHQGQKFYAKLGFKPTGHEATEIFHDHTITDLEMKLTFDRH